MVAKKVAKVAIKNVIYDTSYDTSCNQLYIKNQEEDQHSKVAKVAKKNATNYYCNICDYVSSNKYNYEKHLISNKHNEKISSIKNKYNCEICCYNTNNKYNYDKHIFSVKHKNNITKMEFENNYKLKDINQIKNSDLFVSIMGEIKTMMSEQNKIISEIASKTTNNTTNNITNNNQTNNQQFNLNVFLNETCKDAMNLSEFLENLQVSMEDMEKTGELGFAKGMSRIIMNNLNAIDVCKRPIHCSDVKRETLYVKNNGVWEKETEERKRTKEIIYKVSCLNERQLIKWRDLPRNKGYEKSDHIKNDEFTKLVMEINKLREEEINKVITSVSRHVAIDKEKVKMSGYLN
jgi:hypothetical protein